MRWITWPRKRQRPPNRESFSAKGMMALPHLSPVDAAQALAMVALQKKSGRGFTSFIHGTSMEPTLADGAAIRVGPPEAAGHSVGQIVVCANAHKLIAHRVVYCKAQSGADSFLLTQGDGCLVCDPPIRNSMIQGVVVEANIEGLWVQPSATWTRTPCKQAIAVSNVYAIRLCLAINFRLALFAARIFTATAAASKRFFA